MPAGPYHDALQELQELEHALSKERTRLQARIDFVRAGTGAPGIAEMDQLQRLQEKEQELSQRRRALHRQIDAARARNKS